MKNEYTAVIKQENDWWVGWIEEVPGVNCQEKTYEELKETLEVTLREALDFNRQDALAAVGSGFKIEKISFPISLTVQFWPGVSQLARPVLFFIHDCLI